MDGIEAIDSELGGGTLPEAYEFALLKKAMNAEASQAAALLNQMPQVAPVQAAPVVPKGDFIDVFA